MSVFNDKGETASLFISHVFVSIVLIFAVLVGVCIIRWIFRRSAVVGIVVVIIFRLGGVKRFLRVLSVGVVCGWMVAESE